MTLTNKLINAGFALALFVLLFTVVEAANVLDKRTGLSDDSEIYRHYTVLSAVTTDSTSDALSIAGAKKVQAYFLYNDGLGTATSTFSIEVSPNGTDWYDYNKLISNVANTNSQTITRVATDEMVGTTTAMYSLDLVSDVFDQVRCVVAFASTTVTALDDATCELSIEE